jgi:hypothetical protein
MRKSFKINQYLLSVLTVLAQDTGRSLDDLGEEAIQDLLMKHNRPRTLAEAFRQSLRTLPLNDNGDEKYTASRYRD